MIVSARCLFTRSALMAGISLMAIASMARADVSADAGETVVVVTAAGFQQKVEQAPASISVISRTEIKEERYQSLAEILANVEGVDIGASAGKTGGLNISIRGMGSDYTLVLVDGRRQNVAGNITPNGFGETSTSFLPPPSAIERIEVVRGPVSTLYGSDAMGGVINIITRKVAEDWGGSVTANATLQENDQFGSIYGAEFYTNGPLIADKLGLAVRGSYQTREASRLTYSNQAGNEVAVSARGPSPVENRIWALGTRLSFTPNADHDILLDVNVNKQWYDNSAAQLGTLGAQGYGPSQEFNNEEVVLAHNWRLTNGEIQTSLSRGSRETIGRILPDDVPGTDRERGDPRQLEAINTIFDTKFYSTWNNHTYTVGAQFWDAEMIDGVAPAPYTHQQWALFAEDEWRFTETFALTLGVRQDDHSTFGGQTSPRIYGVWNATPNWTIKGGVSRGFKTPQLNQIAEGITGFTGQGTRPTIGTPSLQPETSTSTEFAVFYDNRDNFRINVTLFHNSFEDMIASGPGLNNCSFGLTQSEYEAGETAFATCSDYGFWPLVETYGQSINVDEAVTQGVETSFRYRMTDQWMLTGNYTYTDTEQKSGPNAGRPLNNVPEHMFNAAVRYQHSETLNLWARAEYRSERYRNEDSATSRAKATWGNYRAYDVYHIGGSYKVNERVSVNAAVYNLFNTDFVSYGAYVSNVNTSAVSYTNLYANNQEPRRLWVSVSTDF